MEMQREREMTMVWALLIDLVRVWLISFGADELWWGELPTGTQLNKHALQFPQQRAPSASTAPGR
jgi:hypothetical protein